MKEGASGFCSLGEEGWLGAGICGVGSEDSGAD